MKIQIVTISLTFISCLSFGQIQLLPGTLDVTGMPNFTQTLSGTQMEAGADDATNGFETDIEEVLISFTLNPSSTDMVGLTSSEQNCNENVFRYEVYIHRSYNYDFEKTIFEAKSYSNSGDRFPLVSPYDSLLIKPLGPRNLNPENGGAYIQIPDDPSRAIKIMEFVGCRQNIPIQFRILPSTLSPAGITNLQIYYTIVAHLM